MCNNYIVNLLYTNLTSLEDQDTLIEQSFLQIIKKLWLCARLKLTNKKNKNLKFKKLARLKRFIQ